MITNLNLLLHSIRRAATLAPLNREIMVRLIIMYRVQDIRGKGSLPAGIYELHLSFIIQMFEKSNLSFALMPFGVISSVQHS